MSDTENYSFELHKYEDSLHDGVIVTKTPPEEYITIDSFIEGDHFRTGPEPITNALMLKLENRLLNIILDESGSMTWNDANRDRFVYLKRLLEKLGKTYPGQIRVNLIGFGGTITSTMILIVPASLPYVQTSSEFNNLSSLAFSNSVYDFSNVIVTRNENHFPTSPGDGAIVGQGIINSAEDVNLTSGKTYYYGVWTFNGNGDRSINATYISAFPYDRILPEGVHYSEADVRILPGVKRDENTQIIYNFAEKEGFIILDSSGNGRHGFSGDNVIADSFWSGDAASRTFNLNRIKSGLGVKFDGQFDIVETDIDASLAYIGNYQSLTINLWLFRYLRLEQEWVIGTSGEIPTNDIGWAIGLNPSGEVLLQFSDISSGFTIMTGVVIPEKEWSMLTVVLNDNISIYINGILSTSFPNNTSLDTSNASKLYIGAKPVDSGALWPGVDYFGCLHFISISNIDRDNSYIQNLYAQEFKTFDSTDLTTNMNVIDNTQREVLIKWVIGDGFNFSGGRVRVVRKRNETPSHPDDGDIVVEQNANIGEFIYLDCYSFIHGSNYIYKIFTFNSLNLPCDAKESRILSVNIPRIYNIGQYVGPNPVTNVSAVPGSKKVMLEWSNPSDPTFKGVKIYYSLNNYPSVHWDSLGNDISTGQVVADISNEVFIHRIRGYSSDGSAIPLPNESNIYYTIYSYNEYGALSTPSFISVAPSIEFSDVSFPPAEITNLHIDIVNSKTLSVQWSNPALESEQIDQYFNDTAVIYVSIKDIYGGKLDDITNMEIEFFTTYKERDIKASQTELGFESFSTTEVFNRNFAGKFPDGEMTAEQREETNMSFSIVDSGLIRGTITNTRDEGILSRRETYVMLVRGKYVITDPETGEETFKFYTNPVRATFHNPLRMSLLNKNSYTVSLPPSETLPRGTRQCFCTTNQTPFSQTINGAFINARNPYVIRVEIQNKGISLPDGYPIVVSSYKSFPKDSDNFLNVKPTFVQVVEGIYNTTSISIPDEDPQGNLTGRIITKSVIDIEVPAPTMPEDVDIYISVEYQGIFAEGIHTVSFIGSLYVEIDATIPQTDGIDISEQFASVWLIDPDDPSNKIDVPDNTMVKWNLIKGRNTKKDRPFYSTEEISEFLSGVYSTTLSGVARHVFFGPIGSVEEHKIIKKCEVDDPGEDCCFGDEYIIQAEVVLGEMSAIDQVVIGFDCAKNPALSNRRILINADPTWPDLVVKNNPEWVTWADGIHMAKFQIAQNPIDSDVLGSDCFIDCVNSLNTGQADSQIFQLPIGHIVQITAPGEILWDVTFDEDPYTGKLTIVDIGGFAPENLSKDQTIPTVANIPIRGSTTDFYIRKNAVISSDPKEEVLETTSSVSASDFFDGQLPNEWKGRCFDVYGCDPIKGTKWVSVTPVKAQTTVMVDGKEVLLIGGGTYSDGIPPVYIGFKEPLVVKIIEARFAGKSGSASRIPLEKDKEGNLIFPSVVADGVSHITFVVSATFAGEPIETVEPLYIEVTQDEKNKLIKLSNCVGSGSGCEVSSSGVVFTHLVNDPFLNKTGPKQSIAYFTIEPLPTAAIIGNKVYTSGKIKVWMDYDKRGDIDELQSEGGGT